MATASVQGARASRPQPQTTGEPPGGPFERHSRKSMRPAYSAGGTAFGATLDNPLSAAPGYLRYLDITLNNTGTNATTVTVTPATTGAGVDAFGAQVTTQK